ncbi:MAG: hypothetical protein P8R54_10150 [Myxococcota bacterium]|nr:hypothetical protein [Myxococcota bacterium]
MKNGQSIEWCLLLQEVERQKTEGCAHHLFEDFRDMTVAKLQNSPEAAAARRQEARITQRRLCS